MNLNQIIWLEFEYLNKRYEAEAIPASYILNNCRVPAFDVYFDNEFGATIFINDDNQVSECYLHHDILKIIRRRIMSHFFSRTPGTYHENLTSPK
jgi:hypothetical protein